VLKNNFILEKSINNIEDWYINKNFTRM